MNLHSEYKKESLGWQKAGISKWTALGQITSFLLSVRGKADIENLPLIKQTLDRALGKISLLGNGQCGNIINAKAHEIIEDNPITNMQELWGQLDSIYMAGAFVAAALDKQWEAKLMSQLQSDFKQLAVSFSLLSEKNANWWWSQLKGRVPELEAVPAAPEYNNVIPLFLPDKKDFD